MKLKLTFHITHDEPLDLHDYFQQDFTISYIKDGVHHKILHTKNHAQCLLSLGDGLINYYQNQIHHFDLYTQHIKYECNIMEKNTHYFR